MNLNLLKSASGHLMGILWALALPSLLAQDTVSSVRIFSQPSGAQFTVDGQVYAGQAVFLWPAGSKHFLGTVSLQNNTNLNTQFILAKWDTNLGTPVSVSPITADPGLTWIKAVFDPQYAVMLRYFSCGSNTTDCPPNSPGVVCIDGLCYTQDSTPYLPAGSTVTLEAHPSTGYIFAGWMVPGVNVGNTFLTSFVLTQAVTVTPRFQNARPVGITIATSPPGLQLLVDRAPFNSPVNVEWGWNTVHALGAIPSQRDVQHGLWIFDSWSDGGALNHNYTVTPGSTPATLLAHFVRGATGSFLTSPPGLALSIDGRTNWPDYTFSWAAGTTHTVSAPGDQIDAQGRKYRFQSWSNDAGATQQVTVANPPVDFRMTAAYDVVAQVRLASVPSGVTLRVDGLECATPCTVERAVGAQVQVSAPLSLPAGDGARLDFAGWSDGAGASRLLTATADPQNPTANYRLSHRLSMASEPADGATLMVLPPSADGYYDAQAQVTVSAQPRAGYRFRRWEGDLAGAALSGTLDMHAPRAVRAVLEAVPYVSDAAVQNGAGLTPDSTVAPGSVVSVFGLHLAPGNQTGPPGPLAQTLAGVTVHLGDRLLPLFFVGPGQINLLLPSDVTPGTQTLSVQAPGQPTVQADFTVSRNAPGLFSWTYAGAVLALAAHDDGTSVTPGAPAQAGERITLYGTGFGPYDQATVDGFPLPESPVFTLADPVELSVNGSATPLDWAGGASGRVGVQAVRFVLDTEVTGSGQIALQVRVNGSASNVVNLPVQ